MSTHMAATGTLVISPDEPVALGASNAAQEPWRGVESHIEANVLALWTASEELPLLFVTLDLLYPGRRLRAAVERAAYPIPPERIIVAASHTHRAPMTDDTKPALGLPNPRYLGWLIGEMTSLVKSVLSSEPEPVTLSIGTSLANHSINRRRRKPLVLSRPPSLNKVVIAPNSKGAKDEIVTALVIQSLHSSKPLAILWNYACHPVAGPTRNAVSGHFPSDVRQIVRKHFNDSAIPVLFLQGFSGNTRPSASAGAQSFVGKIRQVLSGPMFEEMSVDLYEKWVLSLGNVVLEAISETETLDPSIVTARRISLPSSSVVEADKPLDDVTISRIDLHSNVTLVAVSAEVMAEYIPLLRRMLPDRHVLCVGCTDQVIGYIPTQRMLLEGGYEADLFCEPFDLDRVTPTAPSALVTAFKEVLDDVLKPRT